MKFIKVPRADDQHFLIIKVHDVFSTVKISATSISLSST